MLFRSLDGVNILVHPSQAYVKLILYLLSPLDRLLYLLGGLQCFDVGLTLLSESLVQIQHNLSVHVDHFVFDVVVFLPQV